MHQNSLLKLLSVAAALSLASCGGGASSSLPSSVAPVSSPTSSSAATTSSQTTTSSAATTSSVATTSSATTSEATSSSTGTSSSTEASSSPTTSSEEVHSSVEETMVTMTMDATQLVKDSTDANLYTDGFFKCFGCTYDTTKNYIKTGTSDITKATHYIEFTTLGAGTITIRSKTGSSDARNLFVAEKDTTLSMGFKTIGMIKNPTDKSFTEITCNLVKANTYYILTSENCNIDELIVKFDKTNKTTLDYTPFSASASDANILNPMDWALGDVAKNSVFGNWSTPSEGTYFKAQGKRTFTSSDIVTMGYYVPETASVQITPKNAGSISLYAESNATDAGASITLTPSTGSAITGSNLTAVSGAKAWSATTVVNFSNLTAGLTYTLTSNIPMTIFRLSFAE